MDFHGFPLESDDVQPTFCEKRMKSTVCVLHRCSPSFTATWSRSLKRCLSPRTEVGRFGGRPLPGAGAGRRAACLRPFGTS